MSRNIGFYTLQLGDIYDEEPLVDAGYYLDTDTVKGNLTASEFAEFATFSLETFKNIEVADFYFKKSVEAEPDNIFWLGSYAMFLHYYKRDIKNADKYYLKAISDEDDAIYLYNYALFNINELQKYDLAENLLEKSLKLEPQNVKFLLTKAGFLFKIKKDFRAAEKIIMKIFKYKSVETRIWSVYAQLKLLEEDFAYAEDIIDRAFEQDLPPETLLELWFYRYAHFKKWLEKAEFEINKLVSREVKTYAWGLTQNIVLAMFSGHPYPEKLQDIATAVEGIYKY